MWTTSRWAPRAERARRLARIAGALLIASTLGAARSVRADNDGPLQLDWRAPVGCPTAAQVQARLRKLVASDALPLRAEAAIARRPDGRLRLRLVVHASGLIGERELEGRTCEDLTQAAIIHLALLLQGAGSAPDSQPPPAAANAADRSQVAPAPPGARAAGSPTAAADSGKAEPAPERVAAPGAGRIALQLPLALLGLGELPRPVLGVGVAAGVRIARWRLLLDARVWHAQRAPQDASAPAVDLQRAALGVRTCRALTSGTLELSPCLQLSVQQLWARGTGPHVAARSAHQTWAAAALGLQGRLQLLGWLGLVAQLEAQLGTARPRLVLDGEGELERLGAVSLHLSLGMEWFL